MMWKISKLVTNGAWCMTHLSGVDPIGIGPGNQFFFGTRKEIVAALRYCGLRVRNDNSVVEMKSIGTTN